MSSVTSYDVIVIGGGASGMMAAGVAAMRGKRVLLLEKNAELGKKLSQTGGGRCNITNAEEDVHALLSQYGKAADFLYSPFSQFGMKDTFAFFTERGLPLVVEARKRAFPETQSAKDVTRALETFLKTGKVTVRCNVEVCGFESKDGRISGVITNEGVYSAESYILAAGGKSYAKTGSSGEWISWAATLGHTVHAPTPGIVPLKVKESWVKKLSGKSLEPMQITFGTGKEKIVKTGRLLFTHFGISGPLILNASHEVSLLLQGGDVSAHIDLFPGKDIGPLRSELLTQVDLHKNKSLRNLLKEFLPPGMHEAVLSHCDKGIGDTKVHSLSKDLRNYIVDTGKALPLTVTGTMGYDWAVISDGGVELTEVDTKTMASKIYPNLCFTGDVLHINRPSGGFSLQLCWTTGFVAGSHAGRLIEEA